MSWISALPPVTDRKRRRPRPCPRVLQGLRVCAPKFRSRGFRRPGLLPLPSGVFPTTNHLMGQALPFRNLTSHQAPGDLSPAGVGWFLSPRLDLRIPYSLVLSHLRTHNSLVGEHHWEPSRELGVYSGFKMPRRPSPANADKVSRRVLPRFPSFDDLRPSFEVQ